MIIIKKEKNYSDSELLIQQQLIDYMDAVEKKWQDASGIRIKDLVKKKPKEIQIKDLSFFMKIWCKIIGVKSLAYFPCSKQQIKQMKFIERLRYKTIRLIKNK